MSATASKPPKGHTSYTAERTPPRSAGVPPRYYRGSVKPELLRAAVDAASRRGYQAVRVTDITDPANVTRQAFYAHFRDKRHCLCEALDPRLAAIERVATTAAEEDAGGHEEPAEDGFLNDPTGKLALPPGWFGEIIGTIDELLAAHFGSTEGTKGRLIEALATELGRRSSLSGIRIGNLIKEARVPQGDFYRHFSGKRECFAALYEQRLEAVIQGTRLKAADAATSFASSRTDLLIAFSEELTADDARLKLLALGDGELPESDDPTTAASTRGALADALLELLDLDDDHAGRLLVGSLIEVIRSTALIGGSKGLGDRLAEVADGLAGPSSTPTAAWRSPLAVAA